MFLYSWYTREGASQLSREFYDLIQVLGPGIPSGLLIECLSSLLPQTLKKMAEDPALLSELPVQLSGLLPHTVLLSSKHLEG